MACIPAGKYRLTAVELHLKAGRSPFDVIASVYAGFKRIRNLRYSFPCCLHFRIIRISSLRELRSSLFSLSLHRTKDSRRPHEQEDDANAIEVDKIYLGSGKIKHILHAVSKMPSAYHSAL